MKNYKTTTWTGLPARSWDCLGGDLAGDDYEFYLALVRDRGGAALDVGCGTGRLLLRMLQEGLDVDGVDTSKDMLALCEAKADERGLDARLFQQSMAELTLSRSYETIIVPCGSFMLLCDDAQALVALQSLRASLTPQGLLVLSCFAPNSPPKPTFGEWATRSTGTLPDGAQVSMEIMTESYDSASNVVISHRRYTSHLEGREDEVEYLADTYRWYAPEKVSVLLADAGFQKVRTIGSYDSRPLDPKSSVALFLAE